MRKNLKYIILSILIIIAYIGFVYISSREETVGNYPELNVPETPLTVSVSDDQSVLLNDVSASDSEDGDLSQQVFIESILLNAKLNDK